MLRPRPPSATGMERKRGTQVKSPHQAKSAAAFMVAQMSTLRPRAPRKSRAVPWLSTRSPVRPGLRFVQAPLQPERDQSWSDADEENGAPAEVRHHEATTAAPSA